LRFDLVLFVCRLPQPIFLETMSSNEKTGNCIKDASVKTIARILVVTNTLNAALLLLAAILALVLISFTVLLLMTAIYVASFACCLLCFEFRLKAYERIVYENFGLMFSFGGRACFFIFIGILAIGFNSPAGYVSVAYTGVNMLFNYYCMSVHPEYREWLKADNADRRYEAAAGAQNKHEADALKHGITISGAPGVAAAAPADVTPESAFEAGVQIQRPASSTTSAVAPAKKDEWERLYDENTKLYYYHNHATGETRWEEP